MLYKLGLTDGEFDTLEPMSFKDVGGVGQLEKDLEQLIADNILEVLFEDASLMPIFQERQYQPEADVYALNRDGELTVFELKRGTAGKDAVHQALRYAQEAGQWTYAELERLYRRYTGDETADLRLAHQEAFDLEHPLDAKELNNRQHLLVIGSAADEALMNATDYWARQGLSITFLPYRIYEVGGATYFEFFAPPYDKHKNPADAKGVLFDTNRSWDEDAIWYMVENNRVAAFGDAKRFVRHIHAGDLVFFSHRGVGVVAAGRVKKGPVREDNSQTLYRDIEFITPAPEKGTRIVGMPFRKVAELTGKSFYWARTIKVPYLTKDEASAFADDLRAYLESHT